MELPASTDGASPLASTTPTPLAQLSPSLEDLKQRHVRAVVILLWPYSSYTKQSSLLLSEPDFRLRDRKGQVKVSFRDECAEAVAKAQIGIGDTVVLGLEGARWQNHNADVGTPGRGIDWDLAFSSRLLLEVYRDLKLVRTVEVQAPRNGGRDVDGVIPTTPTRSPSTPQLQISGEADRPPPPDNWSSPAFSQKFSASFGPLSNSAFDPLAEEDGYIWGKGRKRTKFGRPSSEWVFVDTPPSPPPATTDTWEDEDLDLEDQEDVTMEEQPSQGDTVPNTQEIVQVEDGTQEVETTQVLEPSKLVFQTENMDGLTSPAGNGISETVQITSGHSQTQEGTAPFSQTASWGSMGSHQPTITPFTSFGNSFEQQPMFNQQGVATPRLRPTLSPGASIISPLETSLAGTISSLPPSRSPLSSQLPVEDSTSHQPVAQATVVESVVKGTAYEVEYRGEATVDEDQNLDYTPGQRLNHVESSPSLSPTSVVETDGRGPDHAYQVEEVDEQEGLDHEAITVSQTVLNTAVEKEEVDITDLDEVEQHTDSELSDRFSRQGDGMERQSVDIDGDGEEDLEETMEGELREPPWEGFEQEGGEEAEEQYEGGEIEGVSEEEAEEGHGSEIQEKLEAESGEELEEESSEDGMEEEVEDVIEEEMDEQDEEDEEDLEMYSGDEMGHVPSVTSSRYESEGASGGYSEAGLEEDTFPPRASYPAVPRAPPEVIVIDSDDEDEVGPAVSTGPSQEELHHSNAVQEPHVERTTPPTQEAIAAGFEHQVEMNGTSMSEAADHTVEAVYHSEAEVSLPLHNIGPVGSEATPEFNQTSRSEAMGLMAESALHAEAESTAPGGESEYTTGYKSEEVNDYHRTSPSFSPDPMSGAEREGDSYSSDEADATAIDPQLYESENQKSPATVSEARGSVDPGLSLDGAADAWHEPRILVSPDSKGRLITPLEIQESTDIRSSPPPSEALSEDDDLVTSQIFRDMEQAERREEPQIDRKLDAADGTTLIEASESLSHHDRPEGQLGQDIPSHADTSELASPVSHSTDRRGSSPAGDAGVQDNTKDEANMPSGKAAETAIAMRDTAMDAIPQPNMNATGLRSRFSYFFPLATLADNFNNVTDTISVVISCSRISQASKGPREYYTTLRLTDPSMNGITVTAQIFRKAKSSLPTAEKGDVVLLRDFKVQSMDHKMMLLSMAASSWAVFSQGTTDGVQMNASPVEFGEEEQRYVSAIREWYTEEGEELAGKHEHLTMAREGTETTDSVSSVASTSPSATGKGSIFKKYARPKKRRHRRITIHELRDGRRYAEVGSPSDKEIIHELRDGTVYANL
ncbi:hypothetical protein AJ79_09531 [Helicocarpus griseus UAMH5409]|uniref:Telomeric single stranded DNA binding POT1/Cdc13 domain-containing protein n=1 Tax=Helicocarpus griseus UAMH5409 TaxID=1447875 RepID=A0A2B7WIW8_9EURO|nr:hypothetical protein AJ79_09531 [Helicocarpus griseus UAMH5409]